MKDGNATSAFLTCYQAPRVIGRFLVYTGVVLIGFRLLWINTQYGDFNVDIFFLGLLGLIAYGISLIRGNNARTARGLFFNGSNVITGECKLILEPSPNHIHSGKTHGWSILNDTPIAKPVGDLVVDLVVQGGNLSQYAGMGVFVWQLEDGVIKKEVLHVCSTGPLAMLVVEGEDYSFFVGSPAEMRNWMHRVETIVNSAFPERIIRKRLMYRPAKADSFTSSLMFGPIIGTALAAIDNRYLNKAAIQEVGDGNIASLATELGWDVDICTYLA
jgi:hypothetical protein